MYKKLISVIVVCAFVFCAFGTVANAIDITVYDSNFSNTYVTYFKALLPNLKFNEHYVVYRANNNVYEMVCGYFELHENKITSLNTEPLTVYRIRTDNTYNGTLNYTITYYDSLNLTYNNNFIYSDLDGFPKLEDRGDIYEIIQTFTIFGIFVGYVILCIITVGKRK